MARIIKTNKTNMKANGTKRSPFHLFNVSPFQCFTFSPFYFFTFLPFLASCSSIDCPLNSLVYTQYQLRNAAGEVDTLSTDTLTISTTRADGNDSVLLNKSVRTTAFTLPISYEGQQDVFFFELKDTLTKVNTIDTVSVMKENTPHFESVDCAPAFFHTITSVAHTNHRIDSIAINNPEVNYDTSKTHLYIYFKKK